MLRVLKTDNVIIINDGTQVSVETRGIDDFGRDTILLTRQQWRELVDIAQLNCWT
jgi:hypothetical protein